MTLVEVAVSAAMLAVLLTMLGSAVGAARREQRRTEMRFAALRSLDNAMEQFLAAPWNEIADDTASAELLPESVRMRWPRARLTANVQIVRSEVVAKRVELTLQLSDSRRDRPLRLTAWIYPAAEE